MLWLGRILAILNVVAVAAFGFMAFQVYAERTQWQRAVFAARLQHAGLPVEETETDDQGNRIVDKLDSAMLQGLPQNVKTVAQAGDALVERIQKHVSDAPPQTKIAVLLPLQKSARDRRITLFRDPQILAGRLRELNADKTELEAEIRALDDRISALDQQLGVLPDDSAKPTRERVQSERKALAADASDARKELVAKLIAKSVAEGQLVVDADESDKLNREADTALSALLNRYKLEGFDQKDAKATRREVARLYAAYLELLPHLEASKDKSADTPQTSKEKPRDAIVQEMVRVVGMEAAAEAISEKALAQYAMAEFVEAEIRRPHLVSFLERQKVLVETARAYERALRQHLVHTDEKIKQVELQKDAAEKQQLALKGQDELRKELEKDTAKRLAKLQTELAKLFKARMEFREANLEQQRNNETLLKKVRELADDAKVRELDKKLNELTATRQALERKRRALAAEVSDR